MRKRPGWELYERLIARMVADQVETDLCVTPNAAIVGGISRTSRQIDVLIENRHDSDNSRRIIVDAKRRARKIDVADVEAFRGVMEDVGATHGYLVSPMGHTKAAEQRAQSLVSMRIVPLNRLENFDPSTWPPCKSHGCMNGRVFWDGYPELTMRLAPTTGNPESGRKLIPFVHYVGKCDRCRKFHVSCVTCGDLFLVPHDDDSDIGHQCQYKSLWFWLGSIEEDEHGRRSAELHVVWPGGGFTADRRSL